VPGHFRAGADQRVWFDDPRLFMDHDGVSLGKPGPPGRLDLALYSSFTVRHGQLVLWYPAADSVQSRLLPILASR